MKSPMFRFLLLNLLLLSGCSSNPPIASSVRPSFAYPVAATGEQVDDYHGLKVRDPYRWLEDENSPQTKAWIEAENKVTFDYLGRIPGRQAIKNRLTQLWNYERYGVPFKQGQRYFFYKNDGLQNQSVLYTQPALDAPARVLLDPNQLSADGTIALTGLAMSDDGRSIAYAVSASGSDWKEWRVRSVETAEDQADHIEWSKFSGASWTKDGRGFFYSRFDQPAEGKKFTAANYFQKLYFHRAGTPQGEDTLIYKRDDQKEWGFEGEVTDDGRYLIIQVSHGTHVENGIFYQDLQPSGSPVVELLNQFDANYSFIDNVGTTFYFRTDLNAPRGRIIAIDSAKPQHENWREIVGEGKDRLEGATLINDQLVVFYLSDAHSQVKIFERDGKLAREVALPGIGTAGGFTGKRADTETFYSFTSFTMPATIYRYDFKTGVSSVFRQPKVAFRPEDFETKQIFYNSKDGTRVPMFISSRRGLKLNGGNPTLLYGYGGFDISLRPAFSPSVLAWMEMGGVFAQPSLRGGGEYGEEWHRGGMKLKKQNVFDDFVAAAEWLISHHYTRREKLAISGGSNGGLLVGACVTQRPDLFGAALPAVGVMDMLRFNKFTGGWAWTSDYGSPENPEEFKALFAYSPYHNIKPGTKFPPTLVTTGDHDDRVVPAHSFKFAAAMQAAQAGASPVLIRIETKAGHGAGKPTTKVIEETADRYGFLVHELKIEPKL